MNAGPILMLLLAVYLLLAFFTGRLEWLFALGQDVADGYSAPAAATPPPGPVPPATTAWRYRPPARPTYPVLHG